MKYYVLLSILFVFFCYSCKTQFVSGEFSTINKGIGYSLILRNDSSFQIEKWYQGCSGRWKVQSDTIILTCDELEPIVRWLASGYIDERIHTLKIINKNKLKYRSTLTNEKTIFLKRKKGRI